LAPRMLGEGSEFLLEIGSHIFANTAIRLP
jgi:hypothetical protein